MAVSLGEESALLEKARSLGVHLVDIWHKKGKGFFARDRDGIQLFLGSSNREASIEIKKLAGRS